MKFAIPLVALFLILCTPVMGAFAEHDGPEIILRSSFVDSEGRANVVGTVRNFASAPVQVTVGLPAADGSVIHAETYGRTIWPLTDSPFKFVLEKGQAQAGEPFLMDVSELQVANHDTLQLIYDGMAVGEERAFVGKVKNNGAFEVRNVSVFAAVHSANHTVQLDTVRSNVIPVIAPGEEAAFVAVPDPIVRPDVLYYSCAGLDYDDPITTVKLGDGKILAYDLTAVAQIKNFRYENSTDSLAFGVRPYSPSGGDLTIKIPQFANNQTVSVLIDGAAHESDVAADGRTLRLDFFVPPGSHEVQIQGVRNLPEIPLAVFGLAGVMAALLGLRFAKAAFKIS
jgi:hypothetical protein